MAKKKKRARQKRPHTDAALDASVVRTRKRRRKPSPEAALREGADDTPPSKSSLPPTKKSSLPPELAHDDREIDARAIVTFSSIVLGMIGVAMVLAWAINALLVDSEIATHTAPSPMATSLPTAPADPKLQRVPKEGLEELRAQERSELDTYGWVDQSRGVVRIPIDRAIDVVAERGLPTRRAPHTDRARVSHPTDSSLDEPGGKP